MKKGKKIFLICLYLVLSAYNSNATLYYMSASGNDNNNGLSSGLAWKTITKLNSMMKSFLPGDEILFERGSYFTGQINVNVSGDNRDPIIFGAYSEGRNPIISGSVPLTGWTVHKGKIYKASVESSVSNLFLNGKQMTLARYPNSGYLTADEQSPNPNKGFFDDELREEKGYWNGSNVRVRTIDWAFEYSPVKSFSNGKVSLLNETLYPIQAGWGYYLDNNLSKLDTAGEWYYEEIGDLKKTVYFYPPPGINIDIEDTEVSIINYGFYSNKNLLKVYIRDLEIKNQRIAGILFSGNNSDVQIENCSFTGQLQEGVNFTRSSENCVIHNCKFFNINGNAINAIKSRGGIFSKNVIRYNGMIPGYGTTSTAFGMTAIAIRNSDSNLIVENNLDSVGYCGINNTGRGNLIEKNFVSNSMLLLNDGAAIKCYGLNSEHSTWRNNFIFYVQGNIDMTNRNEIKAHGLYLDELSSNNSLLNNTIIGTSGSAINLYNGCKNNLIRANICYDDESGIRLYEGNVVMSGNEIIGNVFFSLYSTQVSVIMRASSESFLPAKFNDNYYANPATDNICLYQIGNGKSFFNGGKWESFLGNNNMSGEKIISGNEVKYSRLYYNMSDESLTFLLDPSITYKDLNMNSVFGSITIQPWTSVILLTSTDVTGLSEVNISGGPLVFSDRESSVSQWYNVFGNNLTQPLVVSAPEGFAVSFKSDVNFSKTISINPDNGKVSRVIFVKFVSEESRIYYDFISNQSGALNSLIKVTGK